MTPHAPQLLGSVWVLTQVPLQHVWPAEQGGLQTFWQVPFTQVFWPGGQTVPHDPQLVASLCRLTQPPEQEVKPLAHEHVPLLQTMLAPHALPHPPQLLASVCRLTQVPLQVVWPSGQP